MKTFPISLFVFLALTSQSYGQPYGMGHQDGHFERPETGPTATPLEKIIGHCIVIVGSGNLMAQPCGNVLLILTSSDGGAILNSRTANDGAFEFNIPANKKYRIGVNSRFYEVVGPLTDLRRGQEVNLQLRHK